MVELGNKRAVDRTTKRFSLTNPFGEIPKCDDDLINIISCFPMFVWDSRRFSIEAKHEAFESRDDLIGEGLIIHRKS